MPSKMDTSTKIVGAVFLSITLAALGMFLYATLTGAFLPPR